MPWPKGKTLRVHIGLEDVEDLKPDLAEGFERLAGTTENVREVQTHFVSA